MDMGAVNRGRGGRRIADVHKHGEGTRVGYATALHTNSDTYSNF